jgi:trigger factor
MSHTHEKSYTNIEVKKLPNSEVEIKGEITAEAIEHMKDHAIDHFAKDAELPGFRKGKAPRHLVAQKLGEMTLLYEAAEMALQEAYPQILEEQKLDPIGQPAISITKIAAGNPLGFTMNVALMPIVTIPDYKAVAKKEMSAKAETAASEKDVEEALNRLKRNVAVAEKRAQTGEAGADETKDEKIEDKDLPELTDEFVQKLGQFKTVAEFKKYVKEGLDSEKRREAQEKKRIAVMEALVEKSTIEIPNLLTDGELAKMIANFKQDVEQAGMKFEDYLKQVSKTEEDLKKEWRPTAEKKAKFQLILNKIATDEKIEPAEDQVQKELEHLKKQYKDADESRARIYIETMLMNEKVFEFFESFGPKSASAVSATADKEESSKEKTEVKKEEKE